MAFFGALSALLAWYSSRVCELLTAAAPWRGMVLLAMAAIWKRGTDCRLKKCCAATEDLSSVAADDLSSVATLTDNIENNSCISTIALIGSNKRGRRSR